MSSDSLSAKWKETWKKYARSTPDILNYLPKVIDEFIELAAERCEECVRDRIICYLKPLCPQRIILEILINMNIPSNSLPQLCYTRYLSTFKDNFFNYATEEYQNRTVYAGEFVEQLGGTVKNAYNSKDINKFEKAVRQILSKYFNVVSTNVSKDSTRLWILAQNKLFLFNFAKNYFIIEPDGPINDANVFEEIFMLFTQIHDIKYEGKEEYKNTWTYRFFFPVNTQLGDVIDILHGLTSYASWYSDEKNTILSVEFNLEHLTIQKLKKALMHITKLSG
ncbi:MAG: hypothetical protein QXL15_00945 [Candidatus Korarchaeota archaeon]